MGEAKAYLQQIQKLDAIVQAKRDEYARFEEQATKTTGQISGDRVQASGSQQKMADAVDRYIDLESEIAESIERLEAKRREALEVIEQLAPIEFSFLYKVYFQYKTLGEAASELNKSYSWATTTHGRALQSVRSILIARKGK